MGTKVTVPFVRIVDGDTIRVTVDDGNGPTEESLRILALDTEESHSGGSKPVTPLGHAAKAEAANFFGNEAQVVLEFPGDESLQECLTKYRGNFGRLLVFVSKTDGTDFQQHMIKAGFSPYFTKYGYAAIDSLHETYMAAERTAQAKFVGVWDQITGNGSEVNNYALLKTWWTLRGEIIQNYRSRIANGESILNTRLHYPQLINLATSQSSATIFTEIRDMKRVGAVHMVANIGSRQQPFQIFIPNFESASGQEIIRLLENRYVSSGNNHHRRSYAYVNGPLKLFQGDPSRPPIVELEVTSIDQITDTP